MKVRFYDTAAQQFKWEYQRNVEELGQRKLKEKDREADGLRAEKKLLQRQCEARRKKKQPTG